MLLTRYRGLFGPHDEGAGWHMALTPEVFEALKQERESTIGAIYEIGWKGSGSQHRLRVKYILVLNTYK